MKERLIKEVKKAILNLYPEMKTDTVTVDFTTGLEDELVPREYKLKKSANDRFLFGVEKIWKTIK